MLSFSRFGGLVVWWLTDRIENELKVIWRLNGVAKINGLGSKMLSINFSIFQNRNLWVK